ncbi:hypothetical protein M885DRAFT_627112 [Pelagophyceae sp. CCMP2097]|nr:hypothetical protein M885DRAFT_627112 [Pelagophyceae sp. CCMP2097]
MNTAKRQSARPGDYGAKEAVPAEVRAMARQLGIPAEDMGQADDMWAKLTQMSDADPDGYADLMRASGKHIRKHNGEDVPEEPDDSAAADRAVRRFVDGHTITPAAGFVIKAMGKSGKIMVNCCAHAAVAPPKDASGREIAADDERGRSAQGLHIPMVVGAARPCVVSSKSRVGDGLALDVIFHPWVLGRCDGERGFKVEIAALALSWAEREQADLGLRTDAAAWKLINSKYKGGLGEKGDEPVPFPIDEGDRQEQPPGRRPTAAAAADAPLGVTATPASLLGRLRGDEAAAAAAEAAPADAKLRMPSAGAKRAGIQEVRDDGVVEMGADGFDLPAAPRPRAPAAVKKGFLNGAAKPLYPKGSDQGDATKEGTYSRFMSKCKVVDTSQMSPTDQEAMMRQHAGAPQAAAPRPKAAAPPPRDAPGSIDLDDVPPQHRPPGGGPAVKKGFLDGSKPLYGAGGSGEGTLRQKAANFDGDFEALLREADPEYAAAADHAKKPAPDESDDTLSQLSEFASKLDFQSMFGDFGKKVAPPKPAAEEPEALPEVPRDGFLGGKRGFLGAAAAAAPDAATDGADGARRASHAVADLDPTPGGKRRLQVTAFVAGALSFDDLRLDVSVDTLRVVSKALKYNLRLQLAFDVDPALAAAKFSKKKQQLTVTLTEK